MLRPPAPTHFLRPNDTVWTPPAVLYLDTETRTVPGPAADLEVLRCWVGHYLDRRPRKGAKRRDQWGEGTTAAELAEWITDVSRNRETVWLFCHNLDFDLAATRLPLALVKAGWAIHDAAVGGKAPWMRLGRGKRVLTMADSFSWLPRPLAELGQLVGVTKAELPHQGDAADIWAARCRGDVAILERAMGQLLDWWDENKLGRWTFTGAACGWNAYRHKPSGEQVLIDTDRAAIRFEREAHKGGRRGTWIIGSHAAGPFTELDFVAAYPTIAAHLPLPVGRQYAFDSLPIDDTLIHSERWGILARVLIETDVARFPMEAHGRKWYPVGRFWTTLAGPDIAEAARLGCLRQIGAGHVHKLGMAMAPWARWVLGVQDGHDPSAPPVAQVLAKHWGRAVIGKWASHSFDKLKLGPAPVSAWGYEDGWNHSEGAHCGLLDLAGQRWLITASGDSDNAYPAIPAWVEAHVRVRLNRAIAALGERAVLQCDTDGLILAERAIGTPGAGGTAVAPPSVHAGGRLAWALAQVAPDVFPLVLRPKRRLAHVTILGPQHVVRDGHRRFSGLPGMAMELEPGRYQVKQWPGLQWQMAHGDPRGYVRPIVEMRMEGPWPSGWILDDNAVVPVEATLDRHGNTRLIGWNSSSYAKAGMAPADSQNPNLAPLL